MRRRDFEHGLEVWMCRLVRFGFVHFWKYVIRIRAPQAKVKQPPGTNQVRVDCTSETSAVIVLLTETLARNRQRSHDIRGCLHEEKLIETVHKNKKVELY